MSRLQTTKIWTTKEGKELEIDKMATPHLLATIHMIERKRMENLLSIATARNATQNIIDFYSDFPEEYEALCNEAERRNLIQRGRSKSNAITRR